MSDFNKWELWENRSVQEVALEKRRCILDCVSCVSPERPRGAFTAWSKSHKVKEKDCAGRFSLNLKLQWEKPPLRGGGADRQLVSVWSLDLDAWKVSVNHFLVSFFPRSRKDTMKLLTKSLVCDSAAARTTWEGDWKNFIYHDAPKSDSYISSTNKRLQGGSSLSSPPAPGDTSADEEQLDQDVSVSRSASAELNRHHATTFTPQYSRPSNTQYSATLSTWIHLNTSAR
ncbi:unnamed protein product [Pleuronectes platessa]|uniref:Uncharacterized protein n=1 Tax=Pleuronectes platessa TaxID=8262 RepID=A0A9N7YGN2_PLEPL|nr:unnamed protein product [Pleuronectes platessa]